MLDNYKILCERETFCNTAMYHAYANQNGVYYCTVFEPPGSYSVISDMTHARQYAFKYLLYVYSTVNIKTKFSKTFLSYCGKVSSSLPEVKSIFMCRLYVFLCRLSLSVIAAIHAIVYCGGTKGGGMAGSGCSLGGIFRASLSLSLSIMNGVPHSAEENKPQLKYEAWKSQLLVYGRR